MVCKNTNIKQNIILNVLKASMITKRKNEMKWQKVYLMSTLPLKSSFTNQAKGEMKPVFLEGGPRCSKYKSRGSGLSRLHSWPEGEAPRSFVQTHQIQSVSTNSFNSVQGSMRTYTAYNTLLTSWVTGAGTKSLSWRNLLCYYQGMFTLCI